MNLFEDDDLKNEEIDLFYESVDLDNDGNTTILAELINKTKTTEEIETMIINCDNFVVFNRFNKDGYTILNYIIDNDYLLSTNIINKICEMTENDTIEKIVELFYSSDRDRFDDKFQDYYTSCQIRES